jgi:hypothetical protein
VQDKNVLPIGYLNRCIHPRPQDGAFCSIFVKNLFEFWILTFEISIFIRNFPCFEKNLVLEVEKIEMDFGHGWRTRSRHLKEEGEWNAI